MATFWTSIGVMLIPIGLAVLFQWPNYYPTAFVLMIAGVILGITGLGFTIRDERQKARDDKQRQRDREKEDKWREDQDKKRAHSHYLDTLIQYEMLRALGVNPRRVNNKYRRWLSDKNHQEQLRKYEEEEEEENEV